MSEMVPEGWEIRTSEDIYVRLKVPKVYDRNMVEETGLYPVLDQSTSGKIGFLKSDPDFVCDIHNPIVTFANHTCAVRKMTVPFGVIQNVFPLTSRSDTDIEFIFQILNGGVEQEGYKGHYPKLRETDFLLPPLPEQKKIASILTSVDEVIETTQKQIDKLQDLKKATMNELLTKGIGHTEFKESELGRIPKSWEVRTIRELITKVVDNRGKTPPLSSEGRELIELASILKSQRFLDYKRSKKRVSENTYKTWFRNGHPQIGDILVPTVGLIGECSIVSENRGCIAQNMIALRCSDNLLGDYLYWLMYSEYVLSEIKRVLMGAVQPSLKVPHLLDTRIPLPPTDEQIKILETLNTIENAVIDNQKKVASFQSLKKSLMQDLLTGKVRVQVN